MSNLHDDRLARAARKLREETSGDSPDADRTRARILFLASQHRGRPRRIFWIAPLAAALAAPAAWAAARGELPGVWHEVRALLAPSRAAGGGEGTGHPGGVARQRASAKDTTGPTADAGDPSVPEVAFESLPVAAVPVESLPREIVRSDAPAPSASSPITPAPSSSAQPRSESEASRLYAVAHEAHFVGHDPTATLDAWDAYLHAAPDGPLAPEARYNRALTLIRLGRTDDARDALAPFARGEIGGYRQGEARALLDALDGR